MHLFVIHQFPDLDNFAPIIKKLSEKKKIIILSVYPVHDMKKYDLLNFLVENNVDYFDLALINLKNKILKIFLSLLFLLPKIFLKKIYFFWSYIYHKMNLFSENQIENFINKKKIVSINIDDALPKRFQKIFYNISNNNKLNFFTYKIGIEMRKNTRLNYSDYNFCDKLIIQDNSTLIDQNPENDLLKIYRITSPRYCKEWLDDVEQVYKYRLKDYAIYNGKRNLKIVIFTRPNYQDNRLNNQDRWLEIYHNIKKLKNVDVKIKFKPRGALQPLHVQKNFSNNYSSSELINWCDIVVSHSTSVIIEAIIKNKLVFFMNHFNFLNEKILIKDYNCFINIESDKELVEKIEMFKRKNLNFTFSDKDEFLNKTIGSNYKLEKVLTDTVDKIYL